MRNKVLKISVILVMILSMTMTNFIFVGSSLISYAADSINGATNHKNIEFKAYFKNEEEEEFLYLHVNVKKEGYFNGEVKLENSNFVLKDTDSSCVNRIENNTIYLNQINAGTAEEIKVRIEPIKEENFTIGLLNMTSKINLAGIYRDSTQKDIKIQADREVALELKENNTAENMQNEIQIITNKIIEVNGEEKRILQFSYHMGLKENNYPIQKIEAKIDIPVINGNSPEVQKVEYLNNMKSIEEKFDGSTLVLTLKNEMNEEGEANWKTAGDENVIITCLYDETEQTENMEIFANEKVTLYNNKELEVQNKIVVEAEEVDGILEVVTNNVEEAIYKGKLNAGIDREYESITQVKINFAKSIPEIEIMEENEQAICPVFYRETTLKKEQLEKILGVDGKLTIYAPNGEVIETITSETQANEQGNIVINYENGLTGIKLQTTAPIAEGTIELKHTKMIHSANDIEKVKNANELKTFVKVNEKETESILKLENTETRATLDVNKESLSTVIGNDVEIKAVFISNNEKYDLYKNLEMAIQLPEQVENITINSIDLLYENELKIKNYAVDGRIIRIALEGEQTQYKETVEGATIVINATINVNQKATTKDEVIYMVYRNEEVGNTSKEIKIVAPTDVTPIYSVQDLGVETVGKEETKEILMTRGMEERELEAQIEIINNKENTIENVKVLGKFPTNNEENNMGIEISSGIKAQGIENAKIYYSENAEATEDLENAENGWSETMEDNSQVSKYLMVLDSVEPGTSVQGTYTYKVPANLEYNQMATTAYQAIYVDSRNATESEVESTMLDMRTGIGPRVETKLTATVGGKQITGSVKNGEVIKYTIAVSNTGTEDANNVIVTGQVPEGTTMVVPEEEYEYTGASYYKEVENKNYEATIESLEVGETVYKEYEVRVNTQEGTTITNKAEVAYGDVKKETNEMTNTTEAGNLSVMVKRVTDRQSELYVGGTVSYFAIVENISDKKQDNVKIRSYFSEETKVDKYFLYNEEGFPTMLDYEGQIDIGSLEVGQKKVVEYIVQIERKNEENEITFSAIATEGEKQYQSNVWNDEVKYMEIEIEMTAEPDGQYVKTGDTIAYEIVISNKSKFRTTEFLMKDTIPNQLTINKITQDGREIERSVETNAISIPIQIEANASTTIRIETLVNYSLAREKAEAITNVAHVEDLGKILATTSEISHIIQANDNETGEPTNPVDPENPEEPGTPSKPNEDNEVDNNDVAKGKKTITGMAWYDENANGKKDQGEIALSNIKVRLLNTETNHLVKGEDGQILEATTNGNGIYVLDKIGNGKYIAIFDYDNIQYALTKYKADGVAETENSNAVLNELKIEDEKKQVAATDILEVKDDHIANINIGLVKKQNFDLKLDKYVSRILIQNANGTTVREYNDATIAKVELDAKTINGSTVIVEYKIKVTNQGEVEGYAKKIADYASKELSFSSELNKDWYQVGDILYTNSLANEKIAPGETKTVTLTLTKSMTENSTGLIPNTAEIAEDYNELGIKDSNSTPNNRVKGENDFGSAELALSIKTGGVVYATTGIVVVAILGAIAVIIIKKKNKQDNE